MSVSLTDVDIDRLFDDSEEDYEPPVYEEVEAQKGYFSARFTPEQVVAMAVEWLKENYSFPEDDIWHSVDTEIDYILSEYGLEMTVTHGA